MASSNREKGFSLLELLVVLGLAGIIAALTLPRLGTWPLSDPLASAAARIAGLIAGVKIAALQSGKAHLLVIDLDQGRLWFEEAAAEKLRRPPARAVVVIPERLKLRQVTVAGKSTPEGGPIRVWVSPQGLLRPVVLDLAEPSGRILRVTAHSLYPRVEITARKEGGGPIQSRLALPRSG